jgi:hypothetical protein
VVQETWDRQILHIWAEAQYIVDVLRDAYDLISPELRSNTLVVVTVTSNTPWIFFGSRF